MTLCCFRDAVDVADTRSEVLEKEKQGLRRCESPKPCLENVIQVEVHLNVYSLLKMNKRLKKLGMGVYHCGVVVYGIEWGYGEAIEPTNGSGLFCVAPGQAAGTLYRTLFLGVTTLSPQQVDTILHRLENEWRSSDYHILSHNCNDFAKRFCGLLTTVQKLRVPKWCNRAARVFNRFVPKRLATYVHRLFDEEPPRAPMNELSRVRDIPTSVIPLFWYLHPSISQGPRFYFQRRSSEGAERARHAVGESGERRAHGETMALRNRSSRVISSSEDEKWSVASNESSYYSPPRVGEIVFLSTGTDACVYRRHGSRDNSSAMLSDLNYPTSLTWEFCSHTVPNMLETREPVEVEENNTSTHDKSQRCGVAEGRNEAREENVGLSTETHKGHVRSECLQDIGVNSAEMLTCSLSDPTANNAADTAVPDSTPHVSSGHPKNDEPSSLYWTLNTVSVHDSSTSNAAAAGVAEKNVSDVVEQRGSSRTRPESLSARPKFACPQMSGKKSSVDSLPSLENGRTLETLPLAFATLDATRTEETVRFRPENDGASVASSRRTYSDVEGGEEGECAQGGALFVPPAGSKFPLTFAQTHRGTRDSTNPLLKFNDKVLHQRSRSFSY